MRLPWRIPTFGPAIETSLTTAEAIELQGLAQDRHVLEIGAAYGYSTCLMGRVARSLTSVDPHEIHNSLPILTENLARYAVGSVVEVIVGRSVDVLPGIHDEGWFELVFVDGDHTAVGVVFDLVQARRLAAAGGVLAFHDWGEETCPDVRKVLEAWRQPSYIVDTLAVYRLG